MKGKKYSREEMELQDQDKLRWFEVNVQNYINLKHHYIWGVVGDEDVLVKHVKMLGIFIKTLPFEQPFNLRKLLDMVNKILKRFLQLMFLSKYIFWMNTCDVVRKHIGIHLYNHWI